MVDWVTPFPDSKKQEDALIAVAICEDFMEGGGAHRMYNGCISIIFNNKNIVLQLFQNDKGKKSSPVARDVNFAWSCGKTMIISCGNWCSLMEWIKNPNTISIQIDWVDWKKGAI